MHLILYIWNHTSYLAVLAYSFCILHLACLQHKAMSDVILGR